MVRIATWNLQWAKPGTPRHARCIEQLEQADADVVVTTEHSVFDWDRYPHRIDAGPDWGYRVVEGRRKVIAWSKTPWESMTVGEAGAALGRLVHGVTSVRGVPLRVIGVCIPWRDAHVRSGRRDCKVWDEHRAYLDPLADAIATGDSSVPTLVAGDFNQRLPRSRQPIAVFDALSQALTDVDVLTSGEFECGKLIDHIAASRHLAAETVDAWANVIDGHRLTDHSGVVVDLARFDNHP